MKIKYALLLLLVFIISPCFGTQDTNIPLKLIQKISLPNVTGRIDHLAIDAKGSRLFAACHDNNTVEIIDLISSKHIYTISGLSQPQGVFFVPETGKLYVTNGGNGQCDIFDGASFKPISSIKFSTDADNIRYDPTSRRLYVGYGDGGIGIIDVMTEKHADTIPLTSHPEAFELEDNSKRIFVNIPEDGEIAIADIGGLTIKANWQLKDARSNFPMALDNLDHSLFVGCRNPAKLLIFNTSSGEIINEVPINGDVDDIFYDPVRRYIYISCGNGSLDVIQKLDKINYRTTSRITTAPGARTLLFVPESNRLYLAVPKSAHEDAAIWIYEPQPRPN